MDALSDWIARYERAWASNDPEDIGGLFTDEATYLTAPYREPWRSREDIVAGWLDRKDTPGNWEFEWWPVGQDGDLHFVQGRTTYRQEGTVYANLWVIHLEGDRCSAFTEWWMLERD